MMTKPDATYIVFIMASPQAVWGAVISEELSPLYFFGHRVEAGRNGWSLILSGLKTLLETGAPLPSVKPEPPRQ